MPFKMSSGDSTEELLSQISESKINFDDGNWKQVSNEAKVRIVDYEFFRDSFSILVAFL